MDYGIKRAIAEVKHILASQWSNGMLPQIRFVAGQIGYSPDASEWGVSREISGNPNMDTSGITQPPNVGMAIGKIWERAENKKEITEFLLESVEKVQKYHRFLLTQRDPKRRGLAAIFHPWASGTDNAPCYDGLVAETREFLTKEGYDQAIVKRKDIAGVIEAYRPGEKDYDCYGRLISFYRNHNYDQAYIYNNCPFVVEDVMFNSILAASLHAVGKVSKWLGIENEADDMFDTVVTGIGKYLWDEDSGYFYNFDVRNNRLLTKQKTIHGLMPLLINSLSVGQTQRLFETLNQDFVRAGGIRIPSTAFSASSFEALRYWRGPVWPVTNWLVVEGINNYDPGFASKLRQETVGLISEGYMKSGGKDLNSAAAALMEYTSFGEEFTTPSKQQYCHGWLWDSGFAAIGWTKVKHKEKTDMWEDIASQYGEAKSRGEDLRAVRRNLGKKYQTPLFDEYYCSLPIGEYAAGEPIGAPMMTWTAALFLDLNEIT